MKQATKDLLMGLAMIAALILLVWMLAGAASAPRVRWLNEDYRAHAKWRWEEHKRQYGSIASNVIFQPFEPVLSFNAGVGTNFHTIEIGLRDDGVVVWRKFK